MQNVLISCYDKIVCVLIFLLRARVKNIDTSISVFSDFQKYTKNRNTLLPGILSLFSVVHPGQNHHSLP